MFLKHYCGTRRLTALDDLNGHGYAVLPATAVHFGKEAAAKLLLQGELVLGELPLIHRGLGEVCSMGLSLGGRGHRDHNTFYSPSARCTTGLTHIG